MNKLRLLITGMAFASALTIGAHAVDTAAMTYISNNEFYNADTGQFVYARSEFNGGAVYSNIASGMVTTDPVYISADSGLQLSLYTSGIELSDVDFTSISDPGTYTLCVSSGSEMTYKVMDFTVIRSVSGVVSTYYMPECFAIQSVTLEGEPVSVSSSFVSFDEEGRYSVKYICQNTGIEYDLNLRYDCTPPTLALKELDENGIAHGPVSVDDVEEDATMIVYLDGEKIDVPSGGKLNSSGKYYILLADQAGNTTEYNFIIGVYLNFNAVLFILVIVAVLAAIGIYLYLARKKMRIR